MDTDAHTVFGPLDDWQAMLQRHAELFSEMSHGSAVGFVRRAGSGLQPGKRVAGLATADGEGRMMAWEIGDGGMHASLRAYAGFGTVQVDLLFVAEDAAIGAMRAALDGDALSIMRRLIRQGGIMFYVMRTKYELQDAGYEDFLDTLGLAFLGACR
jgi:hypothetical protein